MCLCWYFLRNANVCVSFLHIFSLASTCFQLLLAAFKYILELADDICPLTLQETVYMEQPGFLTRWNTRSALDSSVREKFPGICMLLVKFQLLPFEEEGKYRTKTDCSILAEIPKGHDLLFFPHCCLICRKPMAIKDSQSIRNFLLPQAFAFGRCLSPTSASHIISVQS